MNKKLFTQIRNEWRSNLWLALELLVVSVVMWYIIDMLYCRVATYMEPRGFDTEHCYLIDMGVLTDKSPEAVVNYCVAKRSLFSIIDSLSKAFAWFASFLSTVTTTLNQFK